MEIANRILVLLTLFLLISCNTKDSIHVKSAYIIDPSITTVNEKDCMFVKGQIILQAKDKKESTFNSIYFSYLNLKDTVLFARLNSNFKEAMINTDYYDFISNTDSFEPQYKIHRVFTKPSNINDGLLEYLKQISRFNKEIHLVEFYNKNAYSYKKMNAYHIDYSGDDNTVLADNILYNKNGKVISLKSNIDTLNASFYLPAKSFKFKDSTYLPSNISQFFTVATKNYEALNDLKTSLESSGYELLIR